MLNLLIKTCSKPFKHLKKIRIVLYSMFYVVLYDSSHN